MNWRKYAVMGLIGASVLFEGCSQSNSKQIGCAENIRSLEAVIEDVQQSSIPIVWNHGGANYPIVFIIARGDNSNKYSFLIHPAQGIRKGRARISYYPTANGKINHKEIISNAYFINCQIQTDGRIHSISYEDGIK